MENTINQAKPNRKELPTRRTKTVDEIAAELGISKSGAYAAIVRGEIPNFRVGGRILVANEVFEDFCGSAFTDTRQKPCNLFLPQ